MILPELHLTSTPSEPLTVIQFTNRSEYTLLMDRNEKWARLNRYTYWRESQPLLAASHSIYFEKVRMALDAFAAGATWVLWVDDDATINDMDQTVAGWLNRYAGRDFIIAREALSWVQGVNAPHYYNFGVWLAHNTPWMRGMLRALLDSERCSDVTVPQRVGNPEQDCFARFVHLAPRPHQLVYPFAELNRDISALSLNTTTASHIGVAPHTQFSCVVDPLETCRPWFLHFQASHKEDLERIAAYWMGGRHWFAHRWKVDLDPPTMGVHYRREALPCYAEPATELPRSPGRGGSEPLFRFVGNLVVCEGSLPRFMNSSLAGPDVEAAARAQAAAPVTDLWWLLPPSAPKLASG
jgi:hypothetical protein